MTECIAMTGATGFIGRAIAKQLIEAGYQVRALVRMKSRAVELKQLGVELVLGDLEDSASLGRLVTGVAAVVHCAGAVRGATEQDFDRVNVVGTQRLVEAIKIQSQPAALLVLSSLAAREPTLSFYSASKAKLEVMLQTQAQDLSWIALRPPAVYGPGDKELLPLFRLMSKGLAPVPGSVESRFSMVFVEDLAAAVVAWLDSDKLCRGIFSIDDGRVDGYNWHDVASIVSDLCHKRVRLLSIPVAALNMPAHINRLASKVFGHAPMLTPEKLNELRHPDWTCDSEALADAIKWSPRVQLAEGLRRTPGWCEHLG